MSSEAAHALRIFGQSLRRGIGAQDDSAVSDADVQVATVDLKGHLTRLALPEWGVTTTGLSPSIDVVVVSNTGVPEIEFDELKRYSANHLFFGALSVHVCGWLIGLTKHVRWQALAERHLVIDDAASKWALAQETPSDVSVGEVGEITWAKNAPDVTDLTQYLLTWSRLPFARKLASRVLELKEDLADDGEHLSAESMFALIRFLEANPRVSRPALAVGGRGYLVGRWTAPAGRTIDVHFIDGETTQVYAMVPDEVKPDRTDVVTTSPSIGALTSRLKALGLLQWMCK
jgi:hypothetical protein